MRKQRGFAVAAVILLILSMIVLNGCAGKAAGEQKNGTADQKNDAAKEQTYHITLFFANDEYVATGDESLKKMKTYTTDLKAAERDVYQKTLELLKTAPEKGAATMISDKIKFNSISRKEDTVTVDLSSDGLSGGSLDETFLISQIVDTLCASFPEVKQVRFLVDGASAETLMGHVDTAEPFSKDLFAE